MTNSLGSQNLVVWGASGHALVVADIIRLAGRYRIVAFYDDKSPRDGEFAGLPLLTQMEQLRALDRKVTRHLILALGHCNARLRLAEVARVEGFELATAIHPKAIIAESVAIGNGSVVVGGAIINPESRLGENVIVNTGASVDHECLIEDGAHIGPGAHLGGRVNIGRAAWVGIGATIKDRIRVGANSIVGAGAVVMNDVQDDTVVVGIPARMIRKVHSNEN